MTTKEAAGAIGVSIRRVQALIKAGDLRAEKHGRDWYIANADVEAYRPRGPGRPPAKRTK